MTTQSAHLSSRYLYSNDSASSSSATDQNGNPYSTAFDHPPANLGSALNHSLFSSSSNNNSEKSHFSIIRPHATRLSSASSLDGSQWHSPFAMPQIGTSVVYHPATAHSEGGGSSGGAFTVNRNSSGRLSSFASISDSFINNNVQQYNNNNSNHLPTHTTSLLHHQRLSSQQQQHHPTRQSSQPSLLHHQDLYAISSTAATSLSPLETDDTCDSIFASLPSAAAASHNHHHSSFTSTISRPKTSEASAINNNNTSRFAFENESSQAESLLKSLLDIRKDSDFENAPESIATLPVQKQPLPVQQQPLPVQKQERHSDDSFFSALLHDNQNATENKKNELDVSSSVLPDNIEDIESLSNEKKEEYLRLVKLRIDFCLEELKRLNLQLEKDRELERRLSAATPKKRSRQFSELFDRPSNSGGEEEKAQKESTINLATTATEEEEEEKQEKQHSEDLICRKWNRGECFKGTHCNYYHECLQCGGPHPKTKCEELGLGLRSDKNEGSFQQNNSEKSLSPPLPSITAAPLPPPPPPPASIDKATADPCIKWNQRDCSWGEKCHRMHVCFNCRSATHRMSECVNNNSSQQVSNSKEDICSNWNEGRCRMGDRCKRTHRCSQCLSLRHPATECTDSQETEQQSTSNSISEQQMAALLAMSTPPREVCINWNNMRCLSGSSCRRRHECSYCGSTEHPAIACPDPQLDAEGLVEAGVEICLNWNRGRCQEAPFVYTNGSRLKNLIVGAVCKRAHACSSCNSPSHPLVKCSSESGVNLATATMTSSSSSSTAAAADRPLVDVCLNWNQNRCKMGDKCKRLHACSVCRKSDHPMLSCPVKQSDTSTQSVATVTEPNPSRSSIISADEVCVNWNHSRCRLGKKCKRLHVCLQCFGEGHTQSECNSSK